MTTLRRLIRTIDDHTKWSFNTQAPLFRRG
jgi:hypothetical protein